MSFDQIHPPIVQSTEDQQQSHSISDCGSAQQPEQTDALNSLAILILADCGRSTNDERLLATVVARLAHAWPDVAQQRQAAAQRQWVGLTEDQFARIFARYKGKETAMRVVANELMNKNATPTAQQIKDGNT